MNSPKLYQPIYRQFIQILEKGNSILDNKSQIEIKEFIKSRQHENGAFTDRGNNPDIYYSLFGVWLSKALKLDSEQNNLASYIRAVQPDGKKIIDKFGLLLIQLVLDDKIVEKPSAFKLLKWISGSGKQLNTAYQFFLFMLSFDALYGKNRVLYFLMRIALSFYRPPKDLPCSFFSALFLAKYLTGKNVKKETEKLFAYFENGKGFKVFKELEKADLLSTAVALFALKKANADLRFVTPDCLSLIQMNYDSGAFLSGDGDENKDLEYTFYGLLALGTLS